MPSSSPQTPPRPAQPAAAQLAAQPAAAAPSAAQLWFTQPASPPARLARAFFLLLACAYFALSYASLNPFLNEQLYTAGGERLPYQYRVLPMFVFRALLHLPAVLTLAAHTPALHRDPYQLVLAAIAFASILGAATATAATIRWFTGDRVFAFWLSLVVVWMAQLDLAYAWDNPFTTPYDTPSLFFFALAIYLVLTRRWYIFYLVFLLAVLNRETACFITVFYLVWEWCRLAEAGRRPAQRLRTVLPHVLAQAALWIALKLALAHHFARNPKEGGAQAGGLFITHFAYNLHELINPGQWPLLASIAGFSLPLLWLGRRSIGSRGLAWALAIIFPLQFALYLLVGVIIEIRIFADWIALATPALALIVFHRLRPAPPSAGPLLG